MATSFFNALLCLHLLLRKAAFITSIASMLVRLSGFLRDIIFSTIFGAGAAADAFYAALRAPNLFREFSLRALYRTSYALAERSEQDGKEAAFALINALMGVLLYQGSRSSCCCFQRPL